MRGGAPTGTDTGLTVPTHQGLSLCLAEPLTSLGVQLFLEGLPEQVGWEISGLKGPPSGKGGVTCSV